MSGYAQLLGGVLNYEESLGLAGTHDSIGYMLAELEYHFHNTEQWYGLNANNLSRGSLTACQMLAGNGAFGEELQIHDGTVIESGSATKKFDFSKMRVTAVGTANRLVFFEFYYGTRAAGVAATTQAGADTITKATHGLSDGTKIMLSSIITSTNINGVSTYYVVNAALDTFQVALTSGGAPIDIQTGDGSCNYHLLTQSLLTEGYVSRTATSPDTVVTPIMSPRVACNSRVWIRAKASGGTNTVDFMIGLHTYNA